MSAAPSPPRLEPNCDVRKLPISPTEAFILSRIDGVSGVLDLSNATGLPESIVLDALDHLSAVGAIVYPGARRSPPAGDTNANGTRAPDAPQAPMRRATLARQPEFRDRMAVGGRVWSVWCATTEACSMKRSTSPWTNAWTCSSSSSRSTW